MQKIQIAALAAWLALATAVVADPLPASIDKVVRAYKVPQESVSLVVQDLDADTPAVSFNALIPRNPASSIKLLTTFVALHVLGPTYTWPTELYATGPIKNGVLDGDLVLKGYGDPYFVLEEFWKMLGQLRAIGVHTIRGDLVIDDTHFSIPPGDPGAFDKQPYRLYNVLPGAVMVNFNAIEFQFFHTSDGKSVAIRANPELPNLTIVNELGVKSGKCTGYEFGITLTVPDITADRVVFSGAFPSGCRAHSMFRSVTTPASYAYGTFKRLWGHWGGEISGGMRHGLAPARRPLLVWQSRPLAEVIRPLNKWSNNVMTRMLLYSLAAAKFKPPFTKAQGIEVLLDYLREKGLDSTGLVIDNGSGLSRDARITVQLMNALLRHAYAAPYMPEFIASMSINGIDGTSRRRFAGRPEAGRMHLKTGRIDNVAAIAGYVKTRTEKDYTVALMINHQNIQSGAGTEIQNAVLKWVYEQ